MTLGGTLITLKGANAIFKGKAEFELVTFGGKPCGYRANIAGGVVLENATLVELCKLVVDNLG